MDALLTALLGCLLGEIGDKSQLLVLALATRYDRNGAVIAGIVAAAIANAAISAFAGAWIGPMLGADARLLFLALATLFLGVGDGPQFLILGIATRTAEPWLAGIGGAIGVIVALMPVVLLRAQLLTILPVRAIRWSGAGMLLLIGAGLALAATGLL